MTLQRHIDAAGKIVDDLFYRNRTCWADRLVLLESLARALAEAENRAAWDGMMIALCIDDLNGIGFPQYIEREIESKYGPRPSQEVKQ